MWPQLITQFLIDEFTGPLPFTDWARMLPDESFAALIVGLILAIWHLIAQRNLCYGQRWC